VLPADSCGEELGGLNSAEMNLSACSLFSSSGFLWSRRWLGNIPAAQVQCPIHCFVDTLSDFLWYAAQSLSLVFFRVFPCSHALLEAAQIAICCDLLKHFI